MSTITTMDTSKKTLLANPQIQQLYAQYQEKQAGTGKRRRQKGRGWSDFVNWLKRNKVISTVAKIAAPIANILVPGIGGTIAGGIGSLAENAGYGRRKMMRGRGSNYGIPPTAYGNVYSNYGRVKF